MRLMYGACRVPCPCIIVRQRIKAPCVHQHQQPKEPCVAVHSACNRKLSGYYFVDLKQPAGIIICAFCFTTSMSRVFIWVLIKFTSSPRWYGRFYCIAPIFIVDSFNQCWGIHELVARVFLGWRLGTRIARNLAQGAHFLHFFLRSAIHLFNHHTDL